MHPSLSRERGVSELTLASRPPRRSSRSCSPRCRAPSSTSTPSRQVQPLRCAPVAPRQPLHARRGARLRGPRAPRCAEPRAHCRVHALVPRDGGAAARAAQPPAAAQAPAGERIITRTARKALPSCGGAVQASAAAAAEGDAVEADAPPKGLKHRPALLAPLVVPERAPVSHGQATGRDHSIHPLGLWGRDAGVRAAKRGADATSPRASDLLLARARWRRG